jgi:predicted glycosyltransferase
MVCRGHSVFVTVKNIESAKSLLAKYKIPFIEIGSKRDGLGGKFIGQLSFLRQLHSICKQYKIEFAIGSSITIAHVSSISRIKSFVFDDDDSVVQPLMARFGHPFADYLVSPDVLNYERKKKQHITYAGYHELAYLHPNRFIPDPSVLKDAGLQTGEPFFIMRFNAFKAHHDVGIHGISIENKKRLIEILSKKGKVFITTERDIEPEFKGYQLKVSPEKAHSLIYYATMLIGDSQTMTSESAVLGTPAIRSNSFVGRISYLEEEEHKYQLTFGFLPDQSEAMFAKIEELLSLPDLKADWQKRRLSLLQDKIDVTAFFVWLISNYPESLETIKKNPEYQYNFR